MNKVYQIAFERIRQALEQNVVPWRMPWQSQGVWPSNLTTLKPYRGLNPLFLAITAMMEGFKSPYWLTARQAGMTGGRVKPGHWKHYTPIFFHKMVESKKEEDKNYPIFMFYQVYNLDQCEIPDLWIPQPPKKKDIPPIQRAEELVAHMPDPPAIEHGNFNASYSPSLDSIRMPDIGFFESSEEYYSTLFHELTHSTGHEKRLDRKKEAKTFDTAFEELVAEIGAGMLCNVVEIQEKILDNETAYIANWLKALGENPSWLALAAGKAQKATDFILNVKFEEKEIAA